VGVTAFGLSLFVTACSVDHAIFTGIDASAPSGTAIPTVTDNVPSMGTVSSNPGGIACGASCSAAFQPGTIVTLTASPDIGAQFAGWPVAVAAAGTGSGRVLGSRGIDCGAACTNTFFHGEWVSLVALPSAGSSFSGWSGGGCSGTFNQCNFPVTAATTVTADFTLAPLTLVVARPGTGAGTVTSSPAGIACGVDCAESYLDGTMVTLTAAAGAGSTFTGWSGGGCTGTDTCTVTMPAATAVTATFTLNMYALTVASAGTGSGSVTASRAGIDCGADCTEMFGHGTTITLTASPSAGSTFTGWSGGGCSGTGTCTVTVTAATTVTATFTLQAYTLTVTKGGTGAGTVTSSPGRHQLRHHLHAVGQPRLNDHALRVALGGLDLRRLERRPWWAAALVGGGPGGRRPWWAAALASGGRSVAA
jgi:Divergent InlB B-repeat domain